MIPLPNDTPDSLTEIEGLRMRVESLERKYDTSRAGRLWAEMKYASTIYSPQTPSATWDAIERALQVDDPGVCCVDAHRGLCQSVDWYQSCLEFRRFFKNAIASLPTELKFNSCFRFHDNRRCFFAWLGGGQGGSHSPFETIIPLKIAKPIIDNKQFLHDGPLCRLPMIAELADHPKCPEEPYHIQGHAIPLFLAGMFSMDPTLLCCNVVETSCKGHGTNALLRKSPIHWPQCLWKKVAAPPKAASKTEADYALQIEALWSAQGKAHVKQDTYLLAKSVKVMVDEDDCSDSSNPDGDFDDYLFKAKMLMQKHNGDGGESGSGGEEADEGSDSDAWSKPVVPPKIRVKLPHGPPMHGPPAPLAPDDAAPKAPPGVGAMAPPARKGRGKGLGKFFKLPPKAPGAAPSGVHGGPGASEGDLPTSPSKPRKRQADASSDGSGNSGRSGVRLSVDMSVVDTVLGPGWSRGAECWQLSRDPFGRLGSSTTLLTQTESRTPMVLGLANRNSFAPPPGGSTLSLLLARNCGMTGKQMHTRRSEQTVHIMLALTRVSRH